MAQHAISKAAPPPAETVPSANEVLQEAMAQPPPTDQVRTDVATAMCQLQLCLARIPDKPAYDLAMRQNPQYVLNSCLLFLRCENFQPLPAAHRVVLHFALKLEWWGLEKLTEERITMDDLDAQGREVLHSSGTIQALPLLDNAGRIVIFAMETEHGGYFRTNDPAKFNGRLLWYYLMALMQDNTEQQEKGIVYVCYGLGFKSHHHERDRAVWWAGCRLLHALPIRIAALHYCYNTPELQPAVDLVAWSMPVSARRRFKPVYGSHEVASRVLSRDGVPVHVLPIDGEGGKFDKKHYTKWLKRRRWMELHPSFVLASSLIEFIRVDDVICHRGQNHQKHVGNLRFASFAKEHETDYHELKSDQTKRVFARWLIDQMKARGMRFLRPCEKHRGLHGLWQEAEYELIQNKVRNLLARRPSTSVAETRTKRSAKSKRKDGLSCSATVTKKQRQI